jgi:hypothetical protein
MILAAIKATPDLLPLFEDKIPMTTPPTPKIRGNINKDIIAEIQPIVIRKTFPRAVTTSWLRLFELSINYIHPFVIISLKNSFFILLKTFILSVIPKKISCSSDTNFKNHCNS